MSSRFPYHWQVPLSAPHLWGSVWDNTGAETSKGGRDDVDTMLGTGFVTNVLKWVFLKHHRLEGFLENDGNQQTLVFLFDVLEGKMSTACFWWVRFGLKMQFFWAEALVRKGWHLPPIRWDSCEVVTVRSRKAWFQISLSNTWLALKELLGNAWKDLQQKWIELLFHFGEVRILTKATRCMYRPHLAETSKGILELGREVPPQNVLNY